jgi:hypothetical protein
MILLGGGINHGTVAAYADGFANAPAGTAQFPTLLNGYLIRPPWKVAGVDYAVGLKTNCTVNTSTSIITETGPQSTHIAGQQMSFRTGHGGTLPTGLSLDTAYFVVNVSGGVGHLWQQAGGQIAVATDALNIAMASSNNQLFPKCSTDGGQTWSAMTHSTIPAVVQTVSSVIDPTHITVSSASGLNTVNNIEIPMASGRYYTTVPSALVGTTLTLKSPIPSTDSITPGANIYASTGWGPAYYDTFHTIVSDYVTPNMFYAVNVPQGTVSSATGLYKWTNCGALTQINAQTTGVGWLKNAGTNPTLKSVPGEAGHLWFTPGRAAPNSHPNANNLLFRTCEGTGSSANMDAVPGFWEVIAVGFGLPAPGKSYPRIYVVGFLDPTGNNLIANATYGIWESTDDPNHGNTGRCTLTGNTWTAIPNSPTDSVSGFPTGWMSPINDIAGDPFTSGYVYMNSTGGMFFGQFP